MQHSAISWMLGALALASLASGCSGRPLSSSDDELGDGDSTDSASEGTSESESTTDDGTTIDDTTTDSTTTDDATTDSTTTDDTTTDQPCGTPAVVYALTIDANTPPEDLACLRQVNTNLWIEGVDWTDLSYLPALEKVGDLHLWDDHSLTSLAGTSLVEIDDLYLSGAALVSTAGLEQLVKLERLHVSGLPAGATIDLPIGLPTVGIGASGTNLDMLANLQPQPSGPVFYVDVGSSAEDIAGLLSCCAMPELHLSLWDTQLTDFTSLQGITVMHGLHVQGAQQLVSLAGLEQLESIGRLEIAGSKCDGQPEFPPIPLTGLAGLDSLATIDSLELSFLFDFQSLAGLPADATVTSLELRNLPLLSNAEADAFATAVQAENPWICGLGGDDFCLTAREGGPCPQ